ncbi:hypothetical protein Godav_018051 [Gossypium davidsonii]|uniref:Uncharacterized protein n=1 Tax=Gossypium davidsonii TaxID=34287 RepID=A0A7J8QV82_GOSDV|nr:hypothetical protein [Gossypium davidsonii]
MRWISKKFLRERHGFLTTTYYYFTGSSPVKILYLFL